MDKGLVLIIVLVFDITCAIVPVIALHYFIDRVIRKAYCKRKGIVWRAREI